MTKKSSQLGMNFSTANGRLLRDILFKLVIESDRNACAKCDEEMTRETFSIEHIVPWLDSEDPPKLFFDLNNITFSHRACNYSARRITNKKYHSEEDRRQAKNKAARLSWAKLSTEEQCKQRRDKYVRNGV